MRPFDVDNYALTLMQQQFVLDLLSEFPRVCFIYRLRYLAYLTVGRVYSIKRRYVDVLKQFEIDAVLR